MTESIPGTAAARDGRRLAVALAVAFALMAPAPFGLRADEPATWLPIRSNDVELAVDDSTINVRTTGGDPYLVWRLPRTRKPSEHVLELRYFCTETIESVAAFIGPPISEAGKFPLPSLSIAEGWQSYAVDLTSALGKPIRDDASLLRIDFALKPGVRPQIRDLRLRAETDEDIRRKRAASARRQQKIDRGRSIELYRKDRFPMRLQQVVVDDRFVTIRGPIIEPREDSFDWRLVEFPPHVSIGDAGIACDAVLEFQDDAFLVRVPRFDGGRDRLYSGWRLRAGKTDQFPFRTARRYPTAIPTASDDHAGRRPRPKTQKGLSGISPRGPLDELPELGIGGVTINLVLNHFLSAKGGDGREPIDAPGSAIFFDSRRFAHYDRLIDFARRHELVVTAIVLIPRAAQPESRSPLVHPESDGGVYAMPDLATARGAGLYATVLDRIAARYASPDRQPGGIVNWIESFHYHRWIDHPDEGGLKLGLRTLPSAEHPFGERKRAWHVYQAIGTDQEAEAVRGLPGP